MHSLWGTLVLAVVLVLCNAFFVLAEFAVVSSPRAAIERLANDGHRVAIAVRRLLNTPRLLDRYIATAQLGITAVSLALGMFGEEALADLLFERFQGWGMTGVVAAHGIASVIAVGGLTLFHIVVGEILPKSIAMQQGERALLRAAPPMQIIFTITAPAVMLLSLLGRMVLRLFGVRRSESSHQHYRTAQELEFVVQESQEGGQLETAAGRMLREIFDFGDLSAGEVMVPRTQIVGLEVGATAEQVLAVLRAHPFTRYPVYADDLDHVVGVVHVKQLLPLLLDRRAVVSADARPAPFVPQTAALDTVLEAMRRDKSQMAVVMDEFGGTAGLVTTDDLSAEIVGEIAAGKAAPLQIREERPGQLFVLGTTRLEDLAETLDMALEHPDVDTVSGLVLMLRNGPAHVGDRIAYHTLTFEVVELEGLGVGACRVYR